jgi:hypothetical protein
VRMLLLLGTGSAAVIRSRFPVSKITFFEIVGILEPLKPELHGQAAEKLAPEVL